MSDEKRKQFDEYIGAVFTKEDDVLQWIQAEAQRQEMPQISIHPYEGYLLGWLIRLVGAKSIVEIGTLAGYSGVWMARALPEDGQLYTVEASSKHAAVARSSFEKAGLSDRVQVLQGDARQTLKKLIPRGPFDFVFIDANKESYPDYLAWAVDNLRSGGLVTAHNVYRHGAVLAPQSDDDCIVDGFNHTLASHPALDSMIIPLGDGVAVGVRK